MKTLGCMIVPSPTIAVSAMLTFELIKGLKCFVILLKSRNGLSEIRSDFPSGQSTSLFIKIIVAFEFNAFS